MNRETVEAQGTVAGPDRLDISVFFDTSAARIRERSDFFFILKDAPRLKPGLPERDFGHIRAKQI
jgi:hypothetical protein